MKFDLYLVRHGETVANRDHILQGHCDYPLTDLGISQSETVGHNLRDISWSKVYSSDLPRAVNTTEYILSKSNTIGVKDCISQSVLVRELAYGVREGLSRSLTPAEAKREYAKRNNMKVEDVIDTAESMESVKTRQKDFILQILDDYVRNLNNSSRCNSSSENESLNTSIDNGASGSKNLPILCVSHGGYIKLFLKTYCKRTAEEKIGNCSVSIVTVEWLDVNKPLEFTCSSSPERMNILL